MISIFEGLTPEQRERDAEAIQFYTQIAAPNILVGLDQAEITVIGCQKNFTASAGVGLGAAAVIGMFQIALNLKTGSQSGAIGWKGESV